MPNSLHHASLSLLTTLTTLLALTTAQANRNTTDSTKRGISWIGTPNSDRDNRIFASSRDHASPIHWYKTWGTWPAESARDTGLEFVPMIHSAENLDDDIANIRRRGVANEHVLTFNEPDGDTDGGGTDMSASDAAEAWETIVRELGEEGDGLKISSPATTGSENGWEWLESWNESCWELYEETGCEFDFVAAHWYGAFEGMASWLGRLHEAWPDKEVWVTEYALPQPAGEEEVEGFMRQSLEWLEETEWVARYAWFGAFREEDANSWTGDVVSLFDDDGGLTLLGSLYMGGEVNGYAVGEGQEEDAAVGLRAGWIGVLVVAAVGTGLLM